MKILWVKADFLHPTNRGGQIRTLEILKRLRLRHEIHFVGIEDPQQPEGVARSGEYCSYAYPVRHRVPHKASLAFAGQLVRGLYSPLPVAVERYRSRAMRRTVDDLLARHRFDSVVCDFLFPAPNISALESCVLFAHNVEAMIWKRHVEHAAGWPRRLYFRLQARRMFAYERHVCRRVKSVITVSQADADVVRGSYGVERVRPVPTGVDVGYFEPKDGSEPSARLVFLGSKYPTSTPVGTGRTRSTP